MRKSVSNQFAALQRRADLTLEELAKKLGYAGPSSVQRYVSPEFEGPYLPAKLVQRAMKLVGLGQPPIKDREVLALGGPLIAREGEGLVPVISYVQAGAWTAVSDPYSLGDSYDEIRPDRRVGPRAYALEVKGDSMMTRYMDGDRIIVDPDIDPVPGDGVIAKPDNEDEATFKQYRPRGVDSRGRQIVELRPLNDLWPTITLDARNPGRIVGVVVEHHSYRRQP